MTKSVNSTKRGWRLILCVVLALMLTMTIFLTACNNDGDETETSTSPSTSTSTTDTLPIKNGNFENITEKEGTTTTYPITSVTSWTKSYDYDLSSSEKAPDTSSSGKSGVITVKSETFADTKVSSHGLTAEQNPGTPVINDDDGNPKDIGDKLLMIRNALPTALRFSTSSSISIASGTYVKITIWVYTTQIEDYYGNVAEKGKVNDFGANITISGSSNSYDSVSIRNINTFDEWKQYTIYIEGSSLQSNTIYIALGLGKGDKNNLNEHVKGYAFFDECNLEKISQKQYLEETASANTYQKRLEGRTEVFDYSDETVASKPVAISFEDKEFSGDSFAGFDSNLDWAIEPSAGAPVDDTGIKGATTLSNLSAYEDIYKNFPFEDENIFFIENTVATSYTASTNNNGNFILPAGKYVAISMWLKTSPITAGTTGAGITLITKGTTDNSSDSSLWVYNSFENIDTSDSNTINSEEDREENPEYFLENWQQYTFVVKNESSKDMVLGLRLSLGAINTTNLDELLYTKGYAAFTNMSVREITASQYSSISSGTYIKKTELLYDSNKNTFNQGFDTPSTNNTDYTQKPAMPYSWNGINGNHASIGGDAEYSDANTISGIVYSSYWNNYVANYPELNISVDDWKGLGDGPLMIYNKDFASYGYFSANANLTMNTFNRISVKVKVIGEDAKAYVYLTETDLNAEVPYSVYKLEIPKSEVNEEFSQELYFALSDTTSLSNTSTPEIINLGDGWIQLNFYIATGDTTKSYRVELWNGARMATDEASGYSKGYVFFNDYEAVTLEYTAFNNLKD